MKCAEYVHMSVCVCVRLQAVVLEGKYWKRKTDAVAREYRKWRVYHMERNVSPLPSPDWACRVLVAMVQRTAVSAPVHVCDY